jgi:ribosomal protein S6
LWLPTALPPALFLGFLPLNNHHMQYELLYIIPATRTEAEAQGVKQDISGMLASHTTKVLRDEMLGKIKLAYPIAGVRYGYYVLAVFDAEPTTLHKLDEALRHAPEVLRHLVTVALPEAATKPVSLVEYRVPDPEQRRGKGAERKSDSKEAAPAAPAAPLSEGQVERQLDAILNADVAAGV